MMCDGPHGNHHLSNYCQPQKSRSKLNHQYGCQLIDFNSNFNLCFQYFSITIFNILISN